MVAASWCNFANRAEVDCCFYCCCSKTRLHDASVRGLHTWTAYVDCLRLHDRAVEVSEFCEAVHYKAATSTQLELNRSFLYKRLKSSSTPLGHLCALAIFIQESRVVPALW